MEENLKLWKSVEKTNPNYTKKATISGGNKITAISPQFQIMNATEKFGAYGQKWGFSNIQLDYSLTNVPNTFKVIDYHTKKEEIVTSVLGLVGFKATFFYPDGKFEIVNSIKIFADKKHNIIDDNFAKKLETDTLTKALSKLGFNADIFLGKFEDVKYMNELNEEFKSEEQKASEEKARLYREAQANKKQPIVPVKPVAPIKKTLDEKGFIYLKSKDATVQQIKDALSKREMTDEQRAVLTSYIPK